ncbi:MAG: hypothetical protein AB7E32_09065 [Desulfovibrio sp.]
MNTLRTLTFSALLVIFSALPALASVMPSGYASYTPSGTIDPLRSDPTNALSYDPLTDDQSGVENFTSLGFGGSIVLTFSNAIVDGAGIDLQIFESTWGAQADNWGSYKETAEVWAYNGVYSGQALGDPGWVLLGTAQQDGAFDFNGLISSTTALLLRDISLASGFTGGGDGYDLDGVVANYATPLPAALWIFGGGLMGLAGMRRMRRNG